MKIVDRITEYKDVSDEDLVRLLQADFDMTVFEVLFHRYRPKIHRKVYLYLKNELDTEDLTQEIFLKLHKKIDKYQFKSSFSTWLYRMVINTCLDFIKSQKRKNTLAITDTDLVFSVLDTPIDFESVQTAFLDMVKQVEPSKVLKVFAQMKSADADILKRRFIEEKSLETLGAYFDLPVNTIKQRLHRAKKRFMVLYQSEAKTVDSL